MVSGFRRISPGAGTHFGHTCATPLTRRVTREGAPARTPRPLVATLTLAGLELREKGRRVSYLLPWGHACVHAAQLEADGVRSERRARRT